MRMNENQNESLTLNKSESAELFVIQYSKHFILHMNYDILI
jgi:hypothetical protein